MTETFDVISPVDGSVYATRPLATAAEIDAVLARAADAQRGWKRTPLVERATVCERAVAWMLEHADAIGEELSWQMGRPIAHAPAEIRRGFVERAAT